MSTTAPAPRRALFTKDHPHYKWVALSNTTLGMLMATINSSIVLISLPAIFNGIKLNALDSGNTSYLLWMLMGFMLVTAVLVVGFGRLGDMYGRVKIYNAGFVLFTIGAIALSLDPFMEGAGALWLILWRVFQGIGAAMLFANSTAILTDAFPAERRGMALGINQIAAIAGSFIGLILGGLLAVIDWRAVFIVSVPLGIIGTIWSFKSLHEVGQKNPGSLDIPGNVLFLLGLTSLLTGITYGIQPYGGQATGWLNPWVLGAIIGGVVLLGAFVAVELRRRAPMFQLRLFRSRAFAMANLAGILAAVGRGGLQFMLIIWLQGIWLPLHGFSYEDTPLWAGIYLLPLTVGFLISGPLAGILSDRWGTRGLATTGLLLSAATFVALLLIPVDFAYPVFAVITFLNGVGSGMFGAPNRSTIMSSVPANQRGSASGMAGTVLNAGSSLSIGIFFSLMVAGLAGSLPEAMRSGLTAHHVPAQAADAVANIPPVGSLFAAFLGYNPIETLLGPTGILKAIPAADSATLTGKEFFPNLIAGPFHDGLVIVFLAAAVMSVIGAIATLAGGAKGGPVAAPTTPEAARGESVLAEADEAIAYRVALAHAEQADRAEAACSGSATEPAR
ncbi:MFS transporter [Amnibacterium kyonggiense]|uniref:EmrB/QacA subfamily drug resistance transporter n=1 Tax=Amnibacterium kyonggiense TaxID=595671 RepID=A0A4V3EA98_9MICO|nr:MFS transporter [Amnibacterium kyonggiense]TDS75588.1 EmrB/QacA subfamily drug resistance transporter [Amnibacterium kyonggiense]